MNQQQKEQATESFLKKHRLCLHADPLKLTECPLWINLINFMWMPDDPNSCEVCGNLHGDQFLVYLMRLDSDDVLEFDYWHSPILRGEPPDNTYLLANAAHWTHYEKDWRRIVDSHEDVDHDLAMDLVEISWEVHEFFTEDERNELHPLL